MAGYRSESHRKNLGTLGCKVSHCALARSDEGQINKPHDGRKRAMVCPENLVEILTDQDQDQDQDMASSATRISSKTQSGISFGCAMQKIHARSNRFDQSKMRQKKSRRPQEK